jgi:hypothetical protein
MVVTPNMHLLHSVSKKQNIQTCTKLAAHAKEFQKIR